MADPHALDAALHPIALGRWRLHATAIAWAGQGLLIIGAPASGKSSLAAALIEKGAALIADDTVQLHAQTLPFQLVAEPTLHGVLALRGMGLLRVPHVATAPLQLVVQLCPVWDADISPTISLLGNTIPRVCLRPADPHAASKLSLFCNALAAGNVLPADWHASDAAIACE